MSVRPTNETGAGGVAAARPAIQRVGGGAIPTPALHEMVVRSISAVAAKAIIVRHHYLHSLPGGTCLTFGVFMGQRLRGALTFGSGPTNTHRLVEGACPNDCLTLTRLWLADDLPRNSESRVLGITLRSLRRHTAVKFLVSYADPAQRHVGTIYQASNWLYTGPSAAMPLLDLGDGVARHSRSVSHAYGTHSLRHFARHGLLVRRVPQQAKHRYLFFLDRRWRSHLLLPVLPYPKQEGQSGDH